MLTRYQINHQDYLPPPVKRMSPIKEVVFTPRGRILARKLMMPTCEKMKYYFTCENNIQKHHFETSAGIFTYFDNMVPEFDTPEEAKIDRHLRSMTTEELRKENNLLLRKYTENNELHIVKYLLQFLSIDDVRSNNNEALQSATRTGNQKLVQLLLDKGLGKNDIEEMDYYGANSYQIAFTSNKRNILNLFDTFYN